MNFYEVLGVNPTATQEEIKTAYRTKALQYHPDRNPDDPAAEAKFKEASTAYETLENHQRRLQYDRKHGWVKNDVADAMFNDLFGAFNNPANSSNTRQQVFARYKASITITLAESLTEQEKFVSITFKTKCLKCFGVGVAKGVRCTKCNGNGCTECKGTGIKYGSCETCKGTGGFDEIKQTKLTIPKGMVTNTQLQSTTEYGVVITAVTVQYPENVRLGAGGRLIMSVGIPYHTAVLGGTCDVSSLEGSKLSVKFPPLKSKSQMIKIKGKGVYASPYASTRGDLFLSPHVLIPENITEEHKTIIEALANLYTREVSNNESTV